MDNQDLKRIKTKVISFNHRIAPLPKDGGFRMTDYWVWCGSAIRGEDGRYHLFVARWPKVLPFFQGYTTHSEIIRAVSDRPEGPYQFEEIVLPDRGASFWDGRMTHNPTIHRYDDTYLLFYIGATFNGPKPDAQTLRNGITRKPEESYQSIRIGYATAQSVYGPWKRPNQPVFDINPDGWDNSVVTNPAPCILRDGRIMLYYRSNTPEGCRLGIAMAEGLGRPFKRIIDHPILGLSIEDPFVWQVDDHFELIAKDLSGKITGEWHAGVHAISPDGINWECAPEPKAYSRTVQWRDGTKTTLGSFERPQLLFENGKPSYLFAAVADGPGGFRKAENTWNVVMPLKTI